MFPVAGADGLGVARRYVSLDEDEADDAWNELVADFSPQLGYILTQSGVTISTRMKPHSPPGPSGLLCWLDGGPTAGSRHR